jgi:hypothetical protein
MGTSQAACLALPDATEHDIDGAITVSSAAASLGGGSSACLELIGPQVTVNSASAIGTTCTGLGVTAGVKIGLVQ